ncbi:hypothetical protein B0A50_05886 [Salinomyces thailandicus]|uniref:Myb-like domain-containing protein n=1 Tax=Salinomyces thailandicus TaxID=706561 RepID=A0A4U0TSQ2_9PEZI|nr:hypothetical protein B0A50_05886 [Salinomyces thailandica]
MTSANLTSRQIQLLSAVCEVMKANIEWTKVAKIANMKTAKYARDSWTTVREKLQTSQALTPRQFELLCAVGAIMKADIDWARVAEQAEFKSGKYARDTWAGVRKKLVAASGAEDTAGEGDDVDAGKEDAAPGREVKKVGTKKRKKAADDDDDDDGDVLPKKKAASRKGSKVKVETAVEEDEEEPVPEKRSTVGNVGKRIKVETADEEDEEQVPKTKARSRKGKKKAEDETADAAEAIINPDLEDGLLCLT